MTVEHKKKKSFRRGRIDFELNEERYKEILLRWVNFGGNDEILPADKDFAELKAVCPDVFEDAFGSALAGVDDDRRWILKIRLNLRAAWSAPDPLTRDWYIFKMRDRYARVVRAHHLKTGPPPFGKKMPNPNFHNVPGRPVGEDFKSLSAAVASGQASFWVDATPEWLETFRASAGERVTFGDAIDNWARDSSILLEPPPPDTVLDRVLMYFLRHGRKALRCGRSGCRQPYFFKTEGARTQWYCELCRAEAEHVRQRKYWHSKGKKRRDKRLKAAKLKSKHSR